MIEIKNVQYIYNAGGDDTKEALRDVSLTVQDGEFVALCGHNGSGKSTLAKLMNGLIEPTRGTVTVDGLVTSDKKNLFDIRKTVGVVFQNPDNQMVASVIEDDVAFGPENLGLPPAQIEERVQWALASVGMQEHRKGTPFRLSGGQKQRIAIAGVLAIKPRVMVLDESTAMLDPVGREEVLEVVTRLNREEGMTVIMITHFMEEAALADRIVVLNRGMVAGEGGKEIFADRALIENAGLELPLSARVAADLRERGLALDGNVTLPEELINALCR
ncbi:MAG: energy-coupling factor transporter ATPase [Clostridia bacterium]|jgi:energy-coupling factor transport system ATP-binding protein|nr:energy-coupling factor transporter ATPase [Clostridia bacterium]